MSEDNQLGPSQDGSVLLDIGGDHGALVIVAPADMAGVEIEIVDSRAHRTHVAIRERRGPAGVRYAGIFPSLTSGDYDVIGTDGRPVTAVSVLGGQVTQIDWLWGRSTTDLADDGQPTDRPASGFVDISRLRHNRGPGGGKLAVRVQLMRA